MDIQPAVSLWNYNHYYPVPELDEILTFLRERGLGVELWNDWLGGKDLFSPTRERWIRRALQGMNVSLHAAIGVSARDDLYRQIDAAAIFGARVLVVHADNLRTGEGPELDFNLGQELISRGADRGVQIALENGQLPILKEALARVEGLKICLDTGHVYLTEHSMAEFLGAFQDQIVHLHLQDILAGPEEELIGLAGIIRDHYTPGSGGIPEADWNLLFEALQARDFQGMGVFEVQPRHPLQTALRGMDYLKRFW